MSKFLVLYRSPTTAQEQIAKATPEQAQAGMEAWQSWMEKAGAAIVDFGAPVQGDGDVTGFSILQAEARGTIDELLADHPHRHIPGASIDVLEFVTLPGCRARSAPRKAELGSRVIPALGVASLRVWGCIGVSPLTGGRRTLGNEQISAIPLRASG